ncbi:LysR family transcriptional regulator [Paracoccus liaowanqingii]|uniref:LysR family transcriptional regulator n=2 Tax=Paracoccus liaowanqingii TaxID=2560053 RepID=A0A4Z1C4J4_9RHOB|nr:LysR family transcriptional regulator [Paracoccus liaowanqingii]
MPKDNLTDIRTFIVVAREGSFTKAAAKYGVSQSAVSYSVRMLEERLGLRLLARTTRSVSPTEAGQRLIDRLAPIFAKFDDELIAMTELRQQPAGTVRISSVEHASETILWPALRPVMEAFPDINIEINNDYRLIDIVAGRFDAGVRLGEQVAQDMIALRIGPDHSQITVASPAYIGRKGMPGLPHDLMDHDCVLLRLPTSGGLYPLTYAKGGEEVIVRPNARAIFNTVPMMLNSVLDGIGTTAFPDDIVAPLIAEGRLVQVLADWTPTRPGYHLYYPSRKQPSPAFSIVLDALRKHKAQALAPV